MKNKDLVQTDVQPARDPSGNQNSEVAAMTRNAGADPTNPDYYKGTAFESIDVIEKVFGSQFHLGNAFKYIARHQKKGGKLDIEKAVWYLKRWLDEDIALEYRLLAWGAPVICDNFWLHCDHVRDAVAMLVMAVERCDGNYSRRSRNLVENAVGCLDRYLANYPVEVLMTAPLSRQEFEPK